ncbi:MAG: SDR family oxidoreductase [bacterium]|nr:SDR family oxidoreductase [bacterium]
MKQKRIAVVTGGNRGLGYGICRRLAREGLKVVLAARDRQRGEDAAGKLQAAGLDVVFHPLDVTDAKSIQALAVSLDKEYTGPDILINNAAILNDRSDLGITVSMDKVRETIETNLIGPLRLCQAVIPSMKRRNYGRIINISSWFGSLEGMGGGYPGYRISKTCLNAMTKILAAELRGSNIQVNAMCPGWVRTDMGGASAPHTPDEAADTAAWLALQKDNGPTGGFFQDRKPYAW